MLQLAGLPFVVEPEGGLGAADRALLARLAAGTDASLASTAIEPFRLELVREAPGSGLGRTAPADGEAASVEVAGDKVRVIHSRFAAELDPARRAGRLFRREGAGIGLEIALRVALSTLLPRAGGLPLHAAGVVAGEQGLAFFGPSGAGKSTLAGACPWPVLSDELVAVHPAPPRILATGFWGTTEEAAARQTSAPLAALIELGQGPRLALEALAPALALRRLLSVIVVPAEAAVWRDALAVAGRLVQAVPVYRIEWSPDGAPWAEIEERLGLRERTP